MSTENDWQWEHSDGAESGVDDAEDSPYAPPDASVREERAGDDRGSSPSIYSPAGVAIGTFLGGPVGATVLLYLNFSRLGWDTRARNTLALGVLATLCAFGLATVLPSGGGTGLTVGWVVAAIWIARHYQNEVEEKYGRVAHLSNWNAAGIGCLSMLGAVVCIVVVLFFFGVPNM